MVIIPDRPSDLIRKGEITDRYYNPEDLFDEVHLVMTNDDRPDAADLERMVGRARLILHNLVPGPRLFLRSLGWRPALLRAWGQRAVTLAQAIRPDVVRCYSATLNAYAAYAIKKQLGVPYVVSLHTSPAELHLIEFSAKQRLANRAIRAVERLTLRNADLVMPVYESIVPMLRDLGARYRVCYNVINAASLKSKATYALHAPVRLLSVGRQFREKDPSPIIQALAELPQVRLTLVGDGTYHQCLVDLAAECGVSDRVEFIPALSNDAVCAMFPDFDIFAVAYDTGGIPKALMEPMLAGVPVVVNADHWTPVAELSSDACLLVEKSGSGFRDGIQRLIDDGALRARLGHAAATFARARWDPPVAERRQADVYRECLQVPVIADPR